MALKENKVINNFREFRCLNIGQLKFFMKKNEEYQNLIKKEAELNKRFRKK